MRKEMLKVGTMLLLAAGLSMSCSDNDEHETQQVRVLQNNGVFVLTSGNSETFAKGALSYYDYATQTASTLDSLITAGGVFSAIAPAMQWSMDPGSMWWCRPKTPSMCAM